MSLSLQEQDREHAAEDERPIIKATQESLRWDVEAFRAKVRACGGHVCIEAYTEENRPLWGYEHRAMPENLELWESEVMACNAMIEHLRDHLNREFPKE